MNQAFPSASHVFYRRRFLRGLGVTMALPWLESMSVWGDEPVAGKASEAPVRLAVLFSGNGFHGKEWWAKGEGDKMELGKVLAPLHDFRQKLLGYSLGRSVQLSDEPLLAEMQSKVNNPGFGVANLVEMIVSSRQFREIRGRETAYEE